MLTNDPRFPPRSTPGEVAADLFMRVVVFVVAVAVIVGLVGCSGGVAIVAYDEATDLDDGEALEELPPWLDDACSILDLDCYAGATGETYGAIVLVAMPFPGGQAGRTIVNTRCHKGAWTVPVSEFAAHELGHLLGLLEHVDDPDNLMAENVDEDGANELDDEQLDTVHRHARRLARCPG